MLMKMGLLAALAVIGGWMLFSGVAAKSRPKRGAEDLAPCPVCGAYRAAGALCPCERRPTP